MYSRRSSRSKGQSLVEFTVLLPLLLIMISGLVEAGIALNVYLDLIDSAREVARHIADFDPIHDGSGTFRPYNQEFYQEAINVADYTLSQAGQIQLDPATDNLVVSVFRVAGSGVDPADRYPQSVPLSEGCPKGDEIGWIAYCNGRESKIGTVACGAKPSCIVLADLLGDLVDVPPDTGIVVVEIYYNYELTLGLPWIEPFFPNPITLHAYTFMPNAASAP